MAHLAPFVKQQFFDANGDPLAGGKIYTYQAGTSTPLATYTDKGGGTANTNPVVLDANGEASVWLDDSAYKFVITDSNDVTLKTIDNVSILNTESITETMMADDSIPTRAIQDLAVTTGKINDSAITTLKINNEAITLEKVEEQSRFDLMKIPFYSNWIKEEPPSTDDDSWMDIAFGNSTFVATALTGTNRVLRSRSNGHSWESIAAAASVSGNGVIFGNNYFVAVGNAGDVMYSSDDGETWTAGTAAENNDWKSVAYGNSVFVAVASTGTNRVMRSTDNGATWTAIAAAEANTWKSVAFGNSVFVAVASDGTNRVMRSTDDGVTWSAVAASSAKSWSRIRYGNGVFMAISSTGVMKSTDYGVTWSDVTIDNLVWQSIAYGNGTWIIYAADFQSIAISTDDGSNWHYAYTYYESEGGTREIAYGDGRFILIGSTTTINTTISGSFTVPEVA